MFRSVFNMLRARLLKLWDDAQGAYGSIVLYDNAFEFRDHSGVPAAETVGLTDLARVSALAGKEPTIAAGNTGQYWRGDKSWQALNAGAVGLGSVENAAASTLYLALAGGTLTGRLGFSGTGHVGLRLNSMTTTQRDALAAGNGDTILNTTTNRLNTRLNGAWAEQIDANGGQTISGSTTFGASVIVGIGGAQFINSSGKILARNNADSAFATMQMLRIELAGGDSTNGDIRLVNGSSNTIWVRSSLNNPAFNITGTSGTTVLSTNRLGLGSTAIVAWHSNVDGSGSGDIGLGRNAAGICEVNNGTAGTLRDVRLRSVLLDAAGGTLQYKSGSNQRAGTATLVAGTITVANTSVTSNTVINASRRTSGGTIGLLSYSVTPGTSFTISSASASDTSTVTYELLEVAP